jgi:hypothetical protein
MILVNGAHSFLSVKPQFLSPHSHPFKPIRSLNEFLPIFRRVIGLNQANRSSPRHSTILEFLAGIHLQFENHSGPIVSSAPDQPIAHNDAGRILDEWLN